MSRTLLTLLASSMFVTVSAATAADARTARRAPPPPVASTSTNLISALVRVNGTAVSLPRVKNVTVRRIDVGEFCVDPTIAVNVNRLVPVMSVDLNDNNGGDFG